MRWLHWLLVALIGVVMPVAFFLLVFLSQARADNLMCSPNVRESVEALRAATERLGGEMFSIRERAQVDAFMASVNAEPPETDLKADAIFGARVGEVIQFGLFDKAKRSICGPITMKGDAANRALDAAGIGGLAI